MVTLGDTQQDQSEAEVSASDDRKRGSPLTHFEEGNASNKRHRSIKSEGNTGDANKENDGQRKPGRRSTAARDSPEPITAGLSPSFNTALSTQRNVNAAGKPPEAGIILKIYVENFMCHRKLTVDLCRNVNFIYGQNGSGKSAILAAIQICLGAGARRTNRARNLKELVRKDATCNCAKIRVTLLNKGDDAYEHDTYGDTITVERTIALRGGYNGYKLYDSENNERSKSKKDLDEMLDKLNIQVENPVAILDQEEAKKFLTGKAADKYNFFMKATELERIDNVYRSTTEQVEELNEHSDRLRATIDSDAELVREAKKIYKQHQEIGKLEAKKAKLQRDLAWSAYKEALAEQIERQEVRKLHYAVLFKSFPFCDSNFWNLCDHVNIVSQKLDAFKERAEQKKQELTQAEAASQEGDDSDNERRKRLEDLAKEAEESSALKQSLEQDLKRAAEPHKALERQLKLLRKEEEKADKSLVLAKDRLQSKRDENAAKAGSAESEQAKRNDQLQRAEQKLATARARHNELKQAVTNALDDYERVEPNVLDARHNVSQLEHQLNGIKSKIQSLESSSGNSFDVFGPRCAKVKKSVDAAMQQRKFRGPVLGPIGFYCKLVPGKDEFAAIAETALGVGVLDRFVVSNDADRKLLQKIRAEAGCQQDCSIFQISQHPRYNIPGPPEIEGIETIATVLSIENDMIFNCLVDNCKIDEKGLTRGKDESERLLLVQNENGANSIRGGRIKEVFFLPKGDNWKLTKNGHKQMVSNSHRLTRSIGADMSAAVEEAKREYHATKQDLDAANRTYNKLEHEHTEHKKRWNFNKRDLMNNQKIMDDAQKEIEDIKTEENTASDIDFDTTVEEQEVAEAQEFLDDSKERQRKLREEIEGQKPAIQDLKYRLDEVTTRNEKVLADLKEAENELTQHFHQLSQIKEKIEKKRQKLIQYEAVITERTKQVVEAEDFANEALYDAKRVQYNQEMLELRFKQREANGVHPSVTQLSEYSQDPTEADLGNIEIPDLATIKDADHYEARINRANEHIEREKERRLANKDDEASAYERYIRAKETYQNKKTQIAEIDEQLTHLRDDMNIRRKRWLDFREFISDYAGLKFDETRKLTSLFFCWKMLHVVLTYHSPLPLNVPCVLCSQYQGIQRNN